MAKLFDWAHFRPIEELPPVTSAFEPRRGTLDRAGVMPFLNLDHEVWAVPFDDPLGALKHRLFMTLNVDLDEPDRRQIEIVQPLFGNDDLREFVPAERVCIGNGTQRRNVPHRDRYSQCRRTAI